MAVITKLKESGRAAYLMNFNYFVQFEKAILVVTDKNILTKKG